MKSIIVTTKTNTHQFKNGVLSIKSSTLIPVKGPDGRMILRYLFDCDLFIPDGVVGLILPPDKSSEMSLAHVGPHVLLPGEHKNAYIDYKLNTDAVPFVYEKDDYCASILFIKQLSDKDITITTTIVEDQVVAEEPQTDKRRNNEGEPEVGVERVVSEDPIDNNKQADVNLGENVEEDKVYEADLAADPA